MFKKIYFIIKLAIISTAWTWLYFMLMHFLFLYCWNFDIFITEYWSTIAQFWRLGGVINKIKDLSFIVSIILIIPIWLFSLIKLLKFDYINIITYPLEWHNNYILRKYGSGSARIMFKNITSSKDTQTIEDMVNTKLKEADKGKEEEKELEANKLRSEIKEKMKNKI